MFPYFPQVVDLDTLKQSSRLVHYCATPLLFDPVFRKQIQEEQIVQQVKVQQPWLLSLGAPTHNLLIWFFTSFLLLKDAL